MLFVLAWFPFVPMITPVFNRCGGVISYWWVMIEIQEKTCTTVVRYDVVVSFSDILLLLLLWLAISKSTTNLKCSRRTTTKHHKNSTTRGSANLSRKKKESLKRGSAARSNTIHPILNISFPPFLNNLIHEFDHTVPYCLHSWINRRDL